MTPKNKVLVLLAHPALEKSRVNRPLADTARKIDGVCVHDLYEAYPGFFIARQAEQKRLLGIDIIVMQHPMYWYSAPALLKEWQDIVLEHGFAYGKTGRALHGKAMMNAFTAGGFDRDFEDASDPIALRQLMQPFERTAQYCGMRYLPPFTTYASGSLADEDIDRQCQRYASLLTGLAAGDLVPDTLARHTTMAAALGARADV